MDDTSVGDLERHRDRLYAELAATGDFRRGSISENYRRCGNRTARARNRIIADTGRATCGRAPWPAAAPRVVNCRPPRWTRCAPSWPTTGPRRHGVDDRHRRPVHPRGAAERDPARPWIRGDVEPARAGLGRLRRSGTSPDQPQHWRQCGHPDGHLDDHRRTGARAEALAKLAFLRDPDRLLDWLPRIGAAGLIVAADQPHKCTANWGEFA